MIKQTLVLGTLVLTLLSCQSQKTPIQTSDVALYSDSHVNFAKWSRDAGTCCEKKSENISISAGGPASAECGMKIQKQQGNVIDTAVAVAFCLNVERDASTSLAGGGFMIFHTADGKNHAIDFREVAPKKVNLEDYFDPKTKKPIEDKTLTGGAAVAVPGMVAGLYEIHKKWGKLPWAKVVTPALELARDGFDVDPMLADKIISRKSDLEKDKYTISLLVDKKGQPLKVGDKFVQKDLASALALIAKNNRKALESGPLANALVKSVQSKGGSLTLDDMKSYEVKFRKPIEGHYKNVDVVSFPPPSAGGVLLVQMMNILEKQDLAQLSKKSDAYVHLLAEVMKRAYADRSDLIGDPDFMEAERAQAYHKIIDKNYADVLSTKIDTNRATPSKEVKPAEFLPKESHGTTHFSIIDKQGNAVSATLTLNFGKFGAAFAVPGYGIFLNDEMDDFSLEAGKQNAYGLVSTDINLLRPGRRPVSSMTPTVVLENGKPVLAIGGAGGSKIITATLQSILNVLHVYPGDLKKSIFAPRVHHQWMPDEVEWEGGETSAMATTLQSKGHKVVKQKWMADVEGVLATYENGVPSFTAVYDPRNQGGVAGN